MATNDAEAPFALSHRTDHSLPLSKLLQRMASNDNDKRKMKEEVESSTVRKRLRHTNGGDDDSSDSPEEEEETSMNQLNTSEEKLYAMCTHGYLFGVWRRWRHPLDVIGHTTHTRKSLTLR
jgi:hypothetical protein